MYYIIQREPERFLLEKQKLISFRKVQFLQRCLYQREYVNFKVLARDCRQVQVNNILANSFFMARNL